MAGTLGASPSVSVWPAAYSTVDHDALLALNALRVGLLDDGLSKLGVATPDSLSEEDPVYGRVSLDLDIPLYRRSGPGHALWWNAMLSLVGILESEGL